MTRSHDSRKPSATSEDAPVTFEQALGEIERLIDRIQSEALNLDALLQMHERALQLLRFCRGRLDLATAQIERQNAALFTGTDADGAAPQ